MKTKYDLMDASETVFDENGIAYPDLATFDIATFVPEVQPALYKMSQNDVYRLYNLLYKYYNTYDPYVEEIIMWLNDDFEISKDENIGKPLKLFKKADIDIFYQRNLK